MSKPIVVIVCMARSSESWEPQQRPHPWHRCAGGGAVHSINTGSSGYKSRKAKAARGRLLILGPQALRKNDPACLTEAQVQLRSSRLRKANFSAKSVIIIVT